jgi:hypothetical protein
LPKPANGMVNIFDDIATYVCDPGFKNLGTTRRRCVNGVWTGIQANCTKVRTLNLRGINQDILLSLSDITEVFGQRLFIPSCKVSGFFRYRARSKRQAISLKAELLDVLNDGNIVIAYAHVLLPVVSEEPQTTCFHLKCFSDIAVRSTVGVVRMAFELESEEAMAVSDLQFKTDQPCDGYILHLFQWTTSQIMNCVDLSICSAHNVRIVPLCTSQG